MDVIYTKAILVCGFLHALIWNQWQLAVSFLRESDIQRSRFSLPLCFCASPGKMQDGAPSTWIHLSLNKWFDSRVERTSNSGKTVDTSLFWQNGIRRNKRAPCVAVWKPVVAATVAAAVVHRRGSAQLPQAVESSCALCHSTGSNSSRTAPCLLGRAGFGTTNAHGWWWSSRMRRLWSGWLGGGGWEGLECSWFQTVMRWSCDVWPSQSAVLNKELFVWQTRYIGVLVLNGEVIC